MRDYYFEWETWVHRIGNLLRIEGEVCLWVIPEYARDIKLGPWYYWRDEGVWRRCVRGSEAYRGALARRIGDDFPFIQARHANTQARHFKRRKD